MRHRKHAPSGSAPLLGACASAGSDLYQNTHWFVQGEATRADWRSVDFRTHATRLEINGGVVTTGRGADALGDPRAALNWLANANAERGRHS